MELHSCWMIKHVAGVFLLNTNAYIKCYFFMLNVIVSPNYEREICCFIYLFILFFIIMWTCTTGLVHMNWFWLWHNFNFRLFLPVQYGTKPEGRLVPMTSSTTQAPRATAVTTASITTTNPATAAPSTQPRGKSPLTTTTSAQGKTPSCVTSYTNVFPHLHPELFPNL